MKTKHYWNFLCLDRVAYREAATFSKPVYRQSQAEYETIRQLCALLMPQFAQSHFSE